MNIDKLTLELLMNKTTYQKYVEKTDPKKFEENRSYKEKVKIYKSRILEITKEYLENPDKQVSLDMNHAFYEYSQSCIRHFEDRDVNELDDDNLFTNYSTDNSTIKSSRKNHFLFDAPRIKKNIESTLKVDIDEEENEEENE
jgi:hypothetical protein